MTTSATKCSNFENLSKVRSAKTRYRLPCVMSEFDRGDLYIDNYYEYTIYPNRKYRNNSEQLDDLSHSWTSLSRFILTFLLRIGFILIQIGSVPVTNINLILLQNVIDFSCVTVVYIIAGFVISYTGDLKGLMGEGHWIEQEETNKEETLIGWQAVVTASAICTSCLVGRTNTVGYLLIAIIMAGIVQPFIIHWAWTPKGWMYENNLHNQSVAFRDYGGSAVVHIVGSLTGTIGCIILGRRIIRLRDIDDASVPADSAGTAFAGYLLILLGLQVFYKEVSMQIFHASQAFPGRNISQIFLEIFLDFFRNLFRISQNFFKNFFRFSVGFGTLMRKWEIFPKHSFSTIFRNCSPILFEILSVFLINF